MDPKASNADTPSIVSGASAGSIVWPLIIANVPQQGKLKPLASQS
jgi:hypothetical protein